MAIKAAGAGTHIDGGGLMLVKADREAGKWIWRYQLAGRRRDMGLGPWPLVGLADARRERDRWAAELARGRDPIAERDRLREEERRAAQAEDPTLEEAAKITLAAIAATLRGGGERGRWISPLATHLIPRLGGRRVSTLTERDVQDALAPIWTAKHATAEKVKQRLRLILDRGEKAGWPCDPRIVDRAVVRLGAVRKVRAPIRATPWSAMPALYARLDRPLRTHVALRLAMLTVVRLRALRFIAASEIAGDVWTIPADRVKGREGKAMPFRVPLSPPAQAIVATLIEARQGDLLLAGASGGAVTDRAMELALDDLGEPGRPHGFRSAFRSWAQDQRIDRDVAEMVLGHKVYGAVEAAYARSDLLDARREVMAAWGAFVAGGGG